MPSKLSARHRYWRAFCGPWLVLRTPVVKRIDTLWVVVERGIGHRYSVPHAILLNRLTPMPTPWFVEQTPLRRTVSRTALASVWAALSRTF